MRSEARTHSEGPVGRGWLARLGPLRPAISALILVTLAVGLAPSSASARTTRLYESSFDPSAGEGYTRGIAVDQSNGDVYVVTWFDDFGSGPAQGKISRFDSTGAPKNFTAGPDAGTNTLTGVRLIGDVAIDSSGGPLDGTIYVVENGNSTSVVRVFANDGESRGALNGSGTPNGSFSLSGLAVDQSNGDVYTAGSGSIWRYTPKFPSGSIDDADFTVTGISPSSGIDIGDGSARTRIAVGPDAIYRTGSFTTNLPHGGVVTRFPLSAFAPEAPEVSGTSIEVEGTPLRAGTLAVDPETGELYAGQRNRVSVLKGERVLIFVNRL